MKVDLYKQSGKKSEKKLELDSTVFDSKINENLIFNAIQIYLLNQRQNNAKAKGRGEVRGGGKKPWRQKGTGRARHGSSRSPIWKGGGVTFGPLNERNYKGKLTKKSLKNAIRSALSLKMKSRSIKVIDKVELDDKQITKQVLKMYKNFALSGNLIFIQSGKDKNLYLGCRNLQNISSIPVNEINVYTVIKSDNIFIIQETLQEITSFWGKVKKEEKGVIKAKVKKTVAKKVKNPAIKKAGKKKIIK